MGKITITKDGEALLWKRNAGKIYYEGGRAYTVNGELQWERVPSQDAARFKR